MDREQFIRAVAVYQLDMAEVVNVINSATRLIVDEPDPPESMTRIAAMNTDARRDDIRPLIDQALTDLGHSALDTGSAARIAARSIAADIVYQRTTPYEGSRQLWRIARIAPEVENHLTAFIGLASEWEDVPAERTSIERAIRAEATKLAN